MNKISRKGFLKIAAAAAMSGVTAGALAACNAASSSTAASSGAAGTYTPGTYTGTAEGISSTVKVTMTFSDSAVTDVVVDTSGETASYGAAAAEELKNQLLNAGSAEIDGVSGSTITSDAVMKAAKSCYAQAKGEAVVSSVQLPTGDANDWLGKEPDIDETAITETVDTDILIVGAGNLLWVKLPEIPAVPADKCHYREHKTDYKQHRSDKDSFINSKKLLFLILRHRYKTCHPCISPCKCIEQDKVDANHKHSRCIQKCIYIKSNLADCNSVSGENTHKHCSKRSKKYSRIQEKPARAVHKQELEMSPSIMEASKMRCPASSIRRECCRHLCYLKLIECSLHNHLTCILHTDCLKSQLHDGIPLISAQSAVEVANITLVEQTPYK